MKPIIYLGLPKTASTYLYHSFDCAENYLKSSIKEWVYLRKIPLHFKGIDRCNIDNNLYRHQKNMLISFREHVNFYIDKSISREGLINLKNSFDIIFEDYSVDNYLKKFKADGKFIVDFSIDNYLCKEQLTAITKKTDVIFLISLRPFLPHLMSLLHEKISHYFIANKIVNISDDFIMPKNFKDHFKKIKPDIIKSLIKTRKLYKKNLSYNSYVQKINDPGINIYASINNKSDDDNYYSATNNILILNSISRIQLKKNSIIFNSKNVTKNLPEILNRITKMSVDIGDVNESKIIKTSIRNSNPELIKNFLLSDEEIISSIFSLYNTALRYHSLHTSSKFMDFFFPDKITKSNLYENYQAQNSLNDINFFDSYF